MADSPTAPTPKSKRPRYFYGWNIIGASFLAHLAYAEQFSSTLGLFFRPLNQEFGWSRFQIALVQTIARSVEAAAAPLVGPLIDRYGARLLMPIGAIIAAAALLAVTQIDSLWQFYLVRGVVAAVGFTLMGFLVTGVSINNWFIRMRGRALAISNVGSSISNVILMPSAVFVIAAFGWRSMFGIFAIITIVVVLIPSAILMRRRPEDMGLLPDGDEPAERDQGADGDAAPTSTIVEEVASLHELRPLLSWTEVSKQVGKTYDISHRQVQNIAKKAGVECWHLTRLAENRGGKW